MGTLTEEIFSRKAGRKVKAGEIVWVDLDRIMSHDTTTLLAIEAMKKIRHTPAFPEKIIIPFDHIVPPANIEQAKIQRKLLDYIKAWKLPHFFQEGICHQVMIEKGFVTPGAVICGGDSHTCSYGALGAFSTGMGSTDIGVAFATGRSWFIVPETIRINVEGSLSPGVYAKDLILHIIGLIGVKGAVYHALEFTGSLIKSFSISQRITLCNMAVECGAKNGIIQGDEKTYAYLNKEPDPNSPKAENGRYLRTIEIDASRLSPLVACPHDIENIKPLEEVRGLPIDEVFIGTCTNGRFDDLEAAAEILKGKRVFPFTRTIIIPASVSIYKKAMARGLIENFLDAGCIVCNPGCGPCLGRHQGTLAPGERALTTMNRNFKGRMGSPEGEIYLASPAVCAASAIKGKIEYPGREG